MTGCSYSKSCLSASTDVVISTRPAWLVTESFFKQLHATHIVLREFCGIEFSDNRITNWAIDDCIEAYSFNDANASRQRFVRFFIG